MAQLTQSDIPADPSATTSLVTSSTEVRRAVIGLLVLAVAAAVLAVLYWRKTGEQARARHLSERGGRHQTAEPVADLVVAPATAVVPELAYAVSQPSASPGDATSHSVFDLDQPAVQVASNSAQQPYPDLPQSSETQSPGETSLWVGLQDETVASRSQTGGRELFG